jgi:predicted nucleic acid-binding protein
MAPERPEMAVYWDASPVLSCLFRDAHSEEALGCSRRPGYHLLSSLAYAEVSAVIARIERERALPAVLADSAREALELGPWHRVALTPAWSHVREQAERWPLRGADLWHLAAALTLQSELPELTLFTFDARLARAATGVGLGA